MHKLKALFYVLAAFVAACSVHIGEGGALLIQLPPIADFISHADLYATGLLVLVEIFSRVTPSPTGGFAPSSFLVRLLDSLIPDRAQGGGRFTSQTVLDGAAA